MANLATLNRNIYEQQRATWQPVEAALLADYNDNGGRVDRVTEAGNEALLADTANAGTETRMLARYGGFSPDQQAYRTRMQGLQSARNVVGARSAARVNEEAQRVDTGMELTRLGGDTLSSGMQSLALAESMKRERKAAEAARRAANRSGLGRIAGMAVGAGLGAFGGPSGAMAGAQVGGELGSLA